MFQVFEIKNYVNEVNCSYFNSNNAYKGFIFKLKPKQIFKIRYNTEKKISFDV